MRLAEVEWNKRRTRARLRFDDDSVIALVAATMREAAPRAGQDYATAEVDRWLGHDANVRAREAALRLLDHRARSRGELMRGLERRGHDPVCAVSIADDLEAAGLLNDAAYAESYVRARIAHRPRGRRALVLELRRRLVDEAIAEAAVGRVLRDEGIGEAGLAERATERWLARQPAAELESARAGDREAAERLYRRARAWLQRRGFPGDVAHAQVARLLERAP
ncbi:MAG: regulatory protein RecX [Gemmatimonadota bacterium]